MPQAYGTAVQLAQMIATGRVQDPEGGLVPRVKAAAAAAKVGDLEGYLGSLAQLLAASRADGELEGRLLTAVAAEFAVMVDQYLAATLSHSAHRDQQLNA